MTRSLMLHFLVSNRNARGGSSTNSRLSVATVRAAPDSVSDAAPDAAEAEAEGAVECGSRSCGWSVTFVRLMWYSKWYKPSRLHITQEQGT